jgi:hypothetical protein
MPRLRPSARRPGAFVAPWALLVLAQIAQCATGTACTPTEPVPAGGETSTGLAEPAERSDDDPVRIKGLRPHLRLHRRSRAGIEELRDGDVARAGDLVQMSYVAAGNRNGVVVSLDGRGQVTLHHPARPDEPATLVARGQHALDHAYELDDAQAYERFVLVTSGDETLSPAAVLAAARDLALQGPAARHSPLPVPMRWRQSSVLLHKRP